MKTIKKIISCVFLFQFSYSTYAIDWSKVEAKQVNLFYPGQSSWEWILTKSDHGGAKSFRKGKDCRECHQGEEKSMGDLLVAGKRLEPSPIMGKRGFVEAGIKTAYDSEKFYIQMTWKEAAEIAAVQQTQDQTRVTILLDDGSVSSIKRGGCWAACHDDSTKMPSAPAGMERGLYLAKSRTKLTRKGGGDNLKSVAALQQLLSEGIFVEYWQAKLNQNKAAVAIDGYILEAPHANQAVQVAVKAQLRDGVWVLEMSRKLSPNRPHVKNIVAGKVYSFSVALHDAYSQGRNHIVSFGYSFALEYGKADFIAVKQ